MVGKSKETMVHLIYNPEAQRYTVRAEKSEYRSAQRRYIQMDATDLARCWRSPDSSNK